MKTKKLLAVALILILVLSSVACLVACNKEEGDVSYGAYVLSDKGTYLAYKKNTEGDKIPNLSLLYEQDNSLKNTYTMIAVNGEATTFADTVKINEIGADCFIKWMSMASTRTTIGDFGKSQYGEALFYLLDGAQTYDGAIASLAYEGSGATTNVIKVSTTTSVNDTGLLGSLETVFEAATGWDIQVASAGTGAAISAAKDGNADLLLVHSASQEKAFIDAKDGETDINYSRVVDGLKGAVTDTAYPERISFMYNFFVLLGATGDPAKVKDCANITAAFEAIANGGYNFISRGDTSGTHSAELKLWKATSIPMTTATLSYTSKGVAKTAENYDIVGSNNTAASWYISAGQGMGACLTMANEYKTIG